MSGRFCFGTFGFLSFFRLVFLRGFLFGVGFWWPSLLALLWVALLLALLMALFLPSLSAVLYA